MWPSDEAIMASLLRAVLGRRNASAKVDVIHVDDATDNSPVLHAWYSTRERVVGRAAGSASS